MKPKDFLEAAANRIVELFEKDRQNRILLADEVGLGKTIIARTVVERVSKLHKSDGDDHFKVFIFVRTLTSPIKIQRSWV